VALTERARNLEQNVVAVIQALRRPLPFDEISRQFSGRTLGRYRKELLAAFSEMQYAEALLQGSTNLEGSGAIPGNVIRERQAEAQSARAALESACERAGLDVWQERARAEAASKDAMRRVEVARQHLASLLLHDAVLNSNVEMPDEGAMGDNDDDLTQLSRVAIRAPFAGTIESRKFSASERVEVSDCLFVLADTSTLWVTADIRENDWAAMQLQPGQELKVTIPAMGDEVRTARLQYIGREVSIDTNAVPVVALLDNAEGDLRPGLFVRVAVPVNVRQDVLSVPLASLLRHDAQSFVFIAVDDNRFRRTNVVVGDRSNDRREIISGVSVGDRVVTQGAFILKSELLLESEEE
jgi:cobalt-zinc-cadmium efflux system membrane fusion protein